MKTIFPNKELFFNKFDSKPILGTLNHGYFNQVEFAFDFFSGNSLIERLGSKKITDLGFVKMNYKNSDKIQTFVQDKDVVFETKLSIINDKIVCEKKIFLKRRNKELIHPYYFTLVPDSWDKNSLYFSSNNGGDIEKYILKAKDKKDSFRLMGFGHRVYKNFDPRAKIIKKAADEVLNDLGVTDPVLEIAKSLEKLALTDEYFVKRKLYPNVDFYSGIIYRALGIPTQMFTVMFALGRLPGWIAQWWEMRKNNEPIGRPRQIFTGKTDLKFVPISKR